eukprot:5301050-Alexandrium_andersonii.AAC.1
MTKVVHCRLQQRTPLDEALADTRNRPLCTELRVDTQCDQHMFNDERFFPYGYELVSDIGVTSALDGQETVPAYGQGTAVTVGTDDVLVEWKNALL